ncbi:MAG: hypothetical protein JXN59_17605 [Anaerolineae bacterium]|nr:hypothetical protein [Anaerolineae bacterium]
MNRYALRSGLMILAALAILFTGAISVLAQGGDTTAIVLGGDEAGLRAMLARTGVSYGPGYDRSEVHVGSLPDEVPFALPLPDNARIIGSILERLSGDLPTLIRIYLNSDLDPQVVTEFYMDTLTGTDWREYSTFQGSGFVDAASTGAIYCYQDAHMVNIDSHPLSDGTTDTQILIHFARVVPTCAQGAAADSPEMSMQQVFALIPQLETPQGVRLLPGGGGGGGGGIGGIRTASTSSYLESEIPLGELLHAYNTQLEAAGWDMVNMESGQFSAWSGWMLADEQGIAWEGALTITVTPADPAMFHATVTVRELLD